MSRDHLIPTPITRADGVQTTVYRRADMNSGGVHAALGKPLEKSPLMDTLKNEASVAVFDETTENMERNDRDQIKRVIASSSAAELRNIKEAMVIARERDENKSWFSRTDRLVMMALIRNGAHSTVKKAVEHYDEVPHDGTLGTFDSTLGEFAVKLEAASIMELMYGVHPEIAPEGMLEKLEGTSPEDIESLRRGIEKARNEGGMGGMAMDSLEDSIADGHSKAALRYGKYADAIPSGMMPNRASRIIDQLIESGVIDLEGSGPDNIASHFKAYSMFEPIAVDRNADDYYTGKGESYADSYDLIAGVEMYPDHIDELMEYRKSRQTEDFDTDLFRDYLAAKSPLMQEGML